MKHLTTLILLVLTTQYALIAQEKLEIEKRINPNLVPTEASAWIKSAYDNPRKLKWYQETSLEGTSFEAKLKWQGRKHSIEFDSLGILEDIEVVLRKRELPEKTLLNINSYLQKQFDKSKIKKIQEQWRGPGNEMKRAVQHGETSDLEIRYELVYWGKNSQENSLWQGLFTNDGVLLDERKIILRPSDNLIY
jgi:hypothetical protein